MVQVKIVRKVIASRPNDFKVIHAKAHAEGMKAGRDALPEPMALTDGINNYYVPEGACGFAWVQFAGNTAWGKWAKAQGIASPAYPKGLQVWVSEFNQSVDRKGAYALAYAKVLNDHGIEAMAQSRLD